MAVRTCGSRVRTLYSIVKSALYHVQCLCCRVCPGVMYLCVCVCVCLTTSHRSPTNTSLAWHDQTNNLHIGQRGKDTCSSYKGEQTAV